MNSFNYILQKLEHFVRKYHTNQLVKGTILFITIGLLYFFFTLFTESVLWLSPFWRTGLFWLFIAIEFSLLYVFILKPLFRLFKLQKGLSYTEASVLLGRHFPEIDDKLLNVLQLKENYVSSSELLEASINQKVKELSPIPFSRAITFKSNIKYLYFLAIPILILGLVFAFGYTNLFSQSLNRVVHYNAEYKPPPPFYFHVNNTSFSVIRGNDYTLEVSVVGEVEPEFVSIRFNDESYRLERRTDGVFVYQFNSVSAPIQFYLEANSVRSNPYSLQLINAPSILGFNLKAKYPKHVKKEDEHIESVGNYTVPEGTILTWDIKAQYTDTAYFISSDTTAISANSESNFTYTKTASATFNYKLAVSNANLPFYESLPFTIDVIKDATPEVSAAVIQDSLNPERILYNVLATDDYGIKKLALIYSPADNPGNRQEVRLKTSSSELINIVGAFPDTLKLVDGKSYTFYFEVTDNDAFNGFKKARSETFFYRKLTASEKQSQQLDLQESTISNIDKTLEDLKKDDKAVAEFKKEQLQKKDLNFSDRQKLAQLLKRQEAQNDLFKAYTEELSKQLNEPSIPENKELKTELQKRLDKQEKQLQHDEDLLKALDSIQQKLNNEDLNKRLEQLSKQNKMKSRSLEQLLELTKRYYVQQKQAKIKSDLDKLAEAQEKLSDTIKTENTPEAQEKLNNSFKDIQKELKELEDANRGLKSPTDFKRDKPLEEQITKQMQEASESLKKEQESAQSQAKKKQQDASNKLKQLSSQLEQSMQAVAQNQLLEDSETLRQILDNLLVFSFEQEKLFNDFKATDPSFNSYPQQIKKQYELRENFEFIDDSLFALSLRQPLISDAINKEIEAVFFNIDKSLEQFSENNTYRGVGFQQYAITATNNLADMLSNSLDNMQNQIQNLGRGTGQSGEMQLPDIIQSQEQLKNEFQKGMNESKKKGEEGKKPMDSNEGLNGKLFEIYKNQQQLKDFLQELLKAKGLVGASDNLLKSAEELSNKLIEEGFTERNLQRFTQLQHELLKLERALKEQGFDNKRTSNTNTEPIEPTKVKPLETDIRKYFNTVEILIKQPLPLQIEYKQKVRAYFKTDD